MEYNIVGKYNKDCKIFAKTVEEDALKMVYSICDCPAFKDQKIRIMPDIHLAQSITIGFSSTIDKQPEFKDGDILHSDETEYSDETIFIAKISGGVIGTYAYIDLFNECVMIRNDPFKKSEINAIRIATDSEKRQLFDALAKEGKAWDAVKKQIVDLKLKIELKPFDKVLVRDGKDEIWEPAFFFRNRPELNVYKYQTVGGKLRVYCIPFNEETAKLIGTSNDWKE